MQIFATRQIRAWDEYTIRHEPIASIDLMERAASACFEWVIQQYKGGSFFVYCSKGNNGGDGLAIARMLAKQGVDVTVSILEFGHKGTDDFQTNLAHLHGTAATIRFISTEDTIHPVPAGAVIIDALLGSGLNRPLEGLTARLVEHLNQSGNEIIAVDLPTGLLSDASSKGNTIIHATHTLAFQCYKLAFLLPENEEYTGEVHILDIGLHDDFLIHNSSVYTFVEESLVQSILKPRKQFSHKGDYGHAALITGSKGMMGAATLCALSCLRSGVGKLTCHIPGIGYTILQVAVPEAMCKTEPGEDHIESISAIDQYDAVGIGPGIGQYDSHAALLQQVFKQSKRPVVIDADALNVLSKNTHLLKDIPAGSVLTPHIKEFERLFGKASNDFERIQTVLSKAAELNIVIVLKGRYTFIATAGGMGYFNSTGNPGMATGGTGDVLTGIITSLLAQDYLPELAAIAGVYIHGLAGDVAAVYHSQTSLIASDVIESLGEAFHRFMK
jgi:ADP-dependent NAD(P)H-hydrate dehydratase / NAD(P)H-hydrate epimerase